ncbi:MAG: hypothetical protein QOI73_181 [Solirubrobacteraceae bacterium]|jgi:hypothetical protein|nr:hypothetical protein [Solirubrobacteraceae bacterium]
MERKTLETAAANYSYLRGLLFIPAGALMILAALGNWEVGPLRHAWVFVALMVALLLPGLPISRYYNEHYGRLTPSMRQQLRAALGIPIGLAVVIGGSLLLRSRAGWSLDLPVNATAVTLAAIMLITYALGVGLKTHHVVIWGALLVAGALPVWTGADPSNIGLVMAGVAVMLSGIFDHRLFVRTFGSPGILELEDGDVRA